MATRCRQQTPDVSRRRGPAFAAALAIALAGTSVAAEPVAEGPKPPEPAGYRMDDYRTPTPATLAGAKALDTAAVEALWMRRAAVFVDVMPRAEKPAGLPPKTIWRDAPRAHLPGSTWLANVGYGALAPEVEHAFARSLARLTAGDKTLPLVFYCRSACWMSWNAAKRALSWGYRDVGWYPEGTDGWTEAGLPLEPATPDRTEP